MAEALSNLSLLILLFFFLLPSSTRNHDNNVMVISMAEAQIEDTSAASRMTAEAMEWPAGAASIYSSYPFGYEEDGEEGGVGGEEEEMGMMTTSKETRRSLLWHRMHYYISYAALSANRIPCPPRSGRSYYTHNCYRARGPVHPYSRNCEAITYCRR